MSMNCDTRQSETVAVALLRRRQTFPPGALFDRLRRALYPDVNVAAMQKNGQIDATMRGSAAIGAARRVAAARGSRSTSSTMRTKITSDQSRPNRKLGNRECSG
jgi:hypothetical protein